MARDIWGGVVNALLIIGIAFLFALPVIMMIVMWFVMDPVTVFDKVLTTFACGFVGALAFIGVALLVAVLT